MKTIQLVILSVLILPSLLCAGEGEIEIAQGDLPLTITTPGSYILTGNLSGDGIGDAIIINSGQVYLDLNGFQMVGTGGIRGDAISIGSFKNVTVRNGTIKGWAREGINATSATQGVFEDLILSGNGLNGIAAGKHCRILNVTSEDNANNGIQADDGSLIRNCLASRNGRDGTGSGIVVDKSCMVLECLTFGNATFEIEAVSGNRIEGNLCDCNGESFSDYSDTGIKVTADDNLVRDNHVTGCLIGYKIDASDNIVVANTAADNGTQFTGDDFSISANSTSGEVTNNATAGRGFLNIRQ
jgi:hypothetical protein